MRLHLSIGLTKDGDWTALYVGDDAEAARAAVEEAGKKKRIVRGLWFKNPHHAAHKAWAYPQNAKKSKAKKGPPPASDTAPQPTPDDAEPQTDADVFKA